MGGGGGGGGGGGERERQRQRQRQRDRERDRERQRERDTEREKQTDRDRERHADTEWQSTDTQLFWVFSPQRLTCRKKTLKISLRHSTAQVQSSYSIFDTSYSIIYWEVQAGLLTPLTFAQHRFSPLAAFTSSAYFLHNGMRWQWICEFYTANFKGIFGGP